MTTSAEINCNKDAETSPMLGRIGRWFCQFDLVAFFHRMGLPLLQFSHSKASKNLSLTNVIIQTLETSNNYTWIVFYKPLFYIHLKPEYHNQHAVM